MIFGDETDSTLESSVTHTWGLKGVTPLMSAQSKRTRLNIVGGISWNGEVFAQATTDSINKLGFKAFLESVLARVPGNVVVLDNSRVHRNAEIVKFVEENERLEIVFLPVYAPELNPAAQARQVLVWGQEENGVEDDPVIPGSARVRLEGGQERFEDADLFFGKISWVGLHRKFKPTRFAYRVIRSSGTYSNRL